jgi:flagellar hook protein FlgE
VLHNTRNQELGSMSLFGAIGTAISGLGAQSAAFGNISDNVANSQTTGFKRIDTSFEDYLTTSTALTNESGAVVASPEYINNIQGSVTQTDNPLALAIAGQGFFAVSQPTSVTNGVPSFNPQQFYSRDGNFQMNSTGYLVNDAGQYLNGWSVNSATNVVNQNALVPIQINQTGYNPVATTTVTLAANLPATPAQGTATPGVLTADGTAVATAASPLSSQITVYDALGTAHAVSLNWVQHPADSTATPPTASYWSVNIQVPDAVASATDPANPEVNANGTSGVTDAGTADVTFGAASKATNPDGTPIAEGTIGSIVSNAADPGTVPTPTLNPGAVGGQPATLSFVTNFGSGDQTITLNLGTYGSASGVTQFAGTAYNLLGLTQNGVPPGSFSGVTTQANGDVQVNYNNGQTRTIAQIPLVTFNAPDQLQRQNGQSFTTTLNSGTPLAEAASSNGAGNLVTSSIEGSNVDIATEFSQLIVAQQAYSSNAKVVTTADAMLQVTINMIT